MKVLLINPERLIHPPFGLLYIGSVLKKNGHDVRLLEIPFDSKKEDYIGLVDREIENFSPGLLGVTCMSMQVPIAREIVGNVRSRFKDIKVIAGGVHPTLEAADALSWGADIVVRGEAEKTIIDVMESLEGRRDIRSIEGVSFKDASRIVHNPDRMLMKALDGVPTLDYSLLERSRIRSRSYAVRGFWLRCGWVMTARGCPGRCIFCASKTMHGRVVREFPMARVLDEVERLKRDYSIDGLWVVDDTFSLKEKRVVEFCEGLKRKGIKLTWACQARVDTFTEGMARAMTAAGCVQVDFGVESGSQKILDYIRKDISTEDTRRAFGIARRNGLRVLATVIVGVPDENEEDIKLTEKLLDDIRPNFVAPFFMTPYPGTELYDTARERGWIDLSGDINWQSTEEPLMRAGMPAASVKDAYNRLLGYNRAVTFEYLRQPLFLRDLLRTFISRPRYLLRAMLCLVKGDRKEAMNLFLYMFRKEMVGSL